MPFNHTDPEKSPLYMNSTFYKTINGRTGLKKGTEIPYRPGQVLGVPGV
jgi:hypothetical protein